jgi:hypothetical protein
MVVRGSGSVAPILIPATLPMFDMPATVSTRQSEAKNPLLFANASET